MEVIKTKRLGGYDVTLIRYGSPNIYEVQISKDPYDEITDYYNEFSTLKDGLKIWSKIVKEIKNGVYDGKF